MPRYLTPVEWDAAFSTLEEQGFVIIPSYFEGEQLEAMAAAQRRVLDQVGRARLDLQQPRLRLPDGGMQLSKLGRPSAGRASSGRPLGRPSSRLHRRDFYRSPAANGKAETPRRCRGAPQPPLCWRSTSPNAGISVLLG